MTRYFFEYIFVKLLGSGALKCAYSYNLMEEKRKKTKGEKYSTNKLKALCFVYAYLISFAHNIRGSVYICMCNCKLNLQNSCVPLNNILFDFSFCQIHIVEKCSKGVVANKIHGNFFLKKICKGAILGDFIFIPAPTTNVSTSLKIPSLAPPFSF